MTEPQYTPGRHTVVPEGDGYALQAYDGDLIAFGLTLADATLFAQAPSLLSAVQMLADDLPLATRREIVERVTKAAGL